MSGGSADGVNLSLFPAGDTESEAGVDAIGRNAFVLRAFALPSEAALLAALEPIQLGAPFRHLLTPGGHTMSVAMTNCGDWGWVSDRRGYRYEAQDPLSGCAWPPMPAAFRALARQAAQQAGFPDFDPDACLINRYAPGARLTLHQDRNESDLSQPIVSVSLGMDAVFQFGNLQRAGPVQRIALRHGDVVVWGGEDRLRHHGVLPLKDAAHPLLGSVRINLTFRRAH